jgi:nitrile hydratase beta subunit
MNSLHDLGGMHGFGEVWTVPEGIAFHSEHERRMFRVMMGLMGGGWGDIDGYRAAVESIPAHIYAQECFPWNYLLGIEQQLRERGLLVEGDLEAWMQGVAPPTRVTAPPAVMENRAEAPLPPLYHIGDRIRTRNTHPDGHTRIPRYLRGQVGTITAERGIFDLPDAIATRMGRRPQPVYTVEFLARDIWGARVTTKDRLSAEMFQDYIEAKVEG